MTRLVAHITRRLLVLAAYAGILYWLAIARVCDVAAAAVAMRHRRLIPWAWYLSCAFFIGCVAAHLALGSAIYFGGCTPPCVWAAGELSAGLRPTPSFSSVSAAAIDFLSAFWKFVTAGISLVHELAGLSLMKPYVALCLVGVGMLLHP